MYFRIGLCLLAVALSTTALADNDAATVVSNALSLTLEHRQRHSDSEVYYWDVTFTGDEIRTLDELLAKAQPYQPKGIVLYIGFNSGELTTKQYTYDITIGIQKQEDQPVLFFLDDPKKKRPAKMYRLLGEDARKFMNYFNAALDAKTKDTKPDRILKD